MSKTIIKTANAPAALGAYNQGTIHAGQLLFTAGQLGMDPVSGELLNGIEAQTRRALENLQAVLEAGNSSLDQVLKVTVFLAKMSDFAVFNSIYGEFFAQDPPARSAFEVAALPKGGLIEIECIAAVA